MQQLEEPDFYLLSGIEQGMRFSDWVNRTKLPSLTELGPNEVDYRLNRCHDLELLERNTIQYEGYKLKFEGYDALALRTFSQRDTITGVGSPLGEGKESDVLEATNGDVVAIKFHREGLTNFREVHREREYTADREHTSWLYTARKAAEHEYKVLQELHPIISVPQPIDHNRQAIVMERMDGLELSRARVEDSNVIQIFGRILEDLARVYDAGYVHGDISEYNIFLSNNNPTLFDWPQAVTADHPNSDEILIRDITNLHGFFARKFPAVVDRNLDISSLVGDVKAKSIDIDELRANK